MLGKLCTVFPMIMEIGLASRKDRFRARKRLGNQKKK